MTAGELRIHDLEFLISPDWRSLTDVVDRGTLTGPDGARVTISAAAVEGWGTEGELRGVVKSLRENAESTISKWLMESGAKVLKPLGPEQVTAGLDAYTTHAFKGEDFYSAVILIRGSAVLLITLEGPKTPAVVSAFRRLLSGIRPARSQ